MSLESGTFVQDLQQTNPPGTDKKKQGDDHLRLIKTVLKNNFPNATRAQYFARARAVTASGGIAATDMAATIAADATGGAISLSLPTLAAGDDGWVVTVIKSDVSANTVTMTGTVNGVANFVLTRQFEGATFIWGGAAWFGIRLRPSIGTIDLTSNSVTDTVLRDSNQVSVIGRSVNSVGDPGDIIAASDGLVLFRNGNVLQFGQIGALGITDGVITPAKLTLEAGAISKGRYHVRDEKANTTDGDAVTAGSFQTAVLNTEKVDDLTVTLSGNVIQNLPAGTYYVKSEATAAFQGNSIHGANQVVSAKMRLRNTSDGITLVSSLGQKFVHNDDGGGSDQAVDMTIIMTMDGYFTLAAPKNIELQRFLTNGLSGSSTKSGRPVSSGEVEVYADLKLLKIG